MGYVYKRPSKAVSVRAASREEKQKAIQKMIEEIRKKTDQKEYVIYTLDETRFSNEPYLVRGWFKKDTDAFLSFLTQLRQRTPEKYIVIIPILY